MTQSGWSRANHEFTQRAATKLGRVGASRSAVGNMYRSQQSATANGRREEFFATGRKEIETVLGYAARIGLCIDKTSPALDFGCGVGRLTRAMAEYFPECCGVDISPTMISMAQELNRDRPRCHFQLNEDTRLKRLQDNYFGFIYTSLVLQHIAPPCSHQYIAELVRVLKPGGVLIFQVPERLRANSTHKTSDTIGVALAASIHFRQAKALRHGDALHQGSSHPKVDCPKRSAGGRRGPHKFLRSFFFRRLAISDARTVAGIRQQAILRGQRLTEAAKQCV